MPPHRFSEGPEMTIRTPMSPPRSHVACDDPRQLRDLLAQSCELARRHTIPSVVVGLAGHEGDVLFPEFLAFVESALRVEDRIFRLTRERVLVFLADVNQVQATQIVVRLRDEFQGRFPTSEPLEVGLGYFEVRPAVAGVTVRDVLPTVFASELLGLRKDGPAAAGQDTSGTGH